MTKPRSARKLGWAIADFKLDLSGRRAILEALGPTSAPAGEVIDAVEIDIAIAAAWRGSQVPIAGRRRLLDGLIAATTAFEQALLDLDQTSWDELASDVDRTIAELPFAAQRYISERLDGATPEKRDFVLEHLAGFPLPPAVPAALKEVARAARAQRKRLEGVETRGKRREDARDNAIRRLAETFHNSAEGDRDYRGRLIDFVVAALNAARLPAPESDEKVWTLVPKALRAPRKGPRPPAPNYKTLADLLSEAPKLRQK